MACQAPLSVGFSRQEYWSGLPCPPPGDLPDPRIELKSPTSPELVQFSSVTHSCLTLCDPMIHSMPGLPVHHQHPKFTQTHVHLVGDAIFYSESVLHMRWPKYWRFNFSISPSNEYSHWLPLGLTSWISSQPKRLSRVSSNTKFKSINISVLSFFYSPALTSIHDYW